MKNNTNIFLSKTIKIYTFLLAIIFILKLVGLDYFGLYTNNTTLIKISDYLGNTYFGDLVCFITIYIQFYFYICITCNKKKLYLPAFIGSSINYLLQILLMHFSKMNWVYYFISFGLMLIIPILVNKKFFLLKQIKYIMLMSVYQLISMFIRNIGVNNNYGNFLIDTLLNIDQLILLGITYNLIFMEGGIQKCWVEQEAGYSSHKKINLLKLLTKLQKRLHNFKEQDKITKITFIIYFVLSFCWNLFTIILILLVAKINDTFIECLFIITSFWLSKKSFGKPFHLPSMLKCFVVSNITYYVLNRVTTPLGISIILPIILGVGLSYITSRFVKEPVTKLYRGMPVNEFDNNILRVAGKDSLQYKICYMFYIDRKSELEIAHNVGYSIDNIKKIKSKINKKIKELN